MPSYPYISGQGALTQTFAQLRKGFPAKVDAGYLQRFKIAPANESYVISILKFLSLIDENGDRVESNTSYFYGDDGSFQAGLEATLRQAYAQLFDEMGAEALEADRGSLTHWFRAADKTSDVVGQRQASTSRLCPRLLGMGNFRQFGTPAPRRLPLFLARPRRLHRRRRRRRSPAMQRPTVPLAAEPPTRRATSIRREVRTSV